MKQDELRALLARPEGADLEFKTSIRSVDSIARAVCAFLNGIGGRVWIGVEEKGSAVGVPDAEAAARSLEKELAAKVSPRSLWTVQVHRLDNLELIEVQVPQGMDKPYLVDGAIYCRRGERDVPATRDEISTLIQRRLEGGQRWERRLAPGAERADLEDALIVETARMAVESQRWDGSPEDPNAFLRAHGLLEQSSPTHAALLLFGKQPTRWLPQARVRLVVMPEGKTGDRFSHDQSFDDCLLSAASKIEAALTRFTSGVAGEFSGQWRRGERVLYPTSALREGVMNALVHRDYDLHGSILISVRQDSLTISNPGGLPEPLTPADLKRDHSSMPRNPDVAHVCFLRRLIEKVGRGTQRIVEDCRASQLPVPKWTSSPAETTLRFQSTPTVGEEAYLNELHEKILALFEGGRTLGAAELLEQLGAGVTDRTLRSYLRSLVEMRRLVRLGKGPRTSYRLTRGEGS